MTVLTLPKIFGESISGDVILPTNLTRVPSFYLHGTIETKNGFDIFLGDDRFVTLVEKGENFLVQMNYHDGSTEICLCTFETKKSGYVVSLQDVKPNI